MYRVVPLLVLLMAQSLPAQAPAQYRVTHTYVLGGDGRWDYVTADPLRQRVFIARENRVMVVDGRDGRLLGEVPGMQGAHGVALVEAGRHAFATSGRDSSVVMFDPTTFHVLGRIAAAEDADAIIYDAVSNRVFTFNGDAHSSTVVDPGPGRVVASIPLDGKPEAGVSAGNGKLYVNIVDHDEIDEIDGTTLTVTRRWSTAPCRQPVGMAIDTTHHRLFSGCRSGILAVSDYQAGRVVATAPIGAGVDAAAFDPAAGDVFASNADGTLTVIHEDAPDRYHLVENVATAPGARTMDLDPATHRLYIVTARFGPPPTDSTAANPRRRPPIVPGSFMMMVVEPTTASR